MGPFIFLDGETTGVDARKNRVIEVACVRWENGVITERFDRLVKPGVPIPHEVVMLTGITDAMVQEAPQFSEICAEVEAFIGTLPIVGHNIAFDTAFLRSHGVALENKEIDTLALARILLPKEASYALEVIMKKHGLTLRDSHRAMVDTETTVEFFEFLQKKIVAMPGVACKMMEPFLKNTAWAGALAFEKMGTMPSDEFNDVHAKVKAPAVYTEPKVGPVQWSADIDSSFLKGGKFLIESMGLPPREILAGTPLVIAYATTRTRDAVVAEAAAAGVTTFHVCEPTMYLSPRKLAAAGAASIHTPIPSDEVPFFLKIALWSTITTTGSREELSLERGEYGQFAALADNEANDAFWTRAKESAARAHIILMHHHSLAHDVPSKLGITKSTHNLIVLDASRLEDSFTNAYRITYTESALRPYFKEKAAIIFGLLGMCYERNSAPDYSGYSTSLIVNDDIRATTEWKRALDALENLPDHPQKATILAAFAPAENYVAWISSFAEEVSFHRAPIALDELFHKSIEGFESVALASPALSGEGSFGLTKKLFALDATWQEIKEPTPASTLKLEIPEKFPEPMSTGYFSACLQLFTKIITEKNTSLFILSSKKTVEAMYTALLSTAREHNVKLLAIGPSGGVGKTMALFRAHPAHAVILATPQIIPFLPEIEDRLETIVFQKLPFDPPDDPVLKLRGMLFENAFQHYTLPRALTKFREILAELRKSGAHTCHLLDSRIRTRDYGALFI